MAAGRLAGDRGWLVDWHSFRWDPRHHTSDSNHLVLVLVLRAGLAASTLLAQLVYDVPANVILDSAARAISAWDIITSMIKAWVFGVIISVVRVSMYSLSAVWRVSP